MCIKHNWYNAGNNRAYECLFDYIRENEKVEDNSDKYLDIVGDIARNIYEHTDVDDYSDFSEDDVAYVIMNEATIHYWYWESPEY